MAKIFEKYTINGSCVMEKMAGTESTAKITSVNSITKSTIKTDVINSLPFLRMKKSDPVYSLSTRKIREASFTIL